MRNAVRIFAAVFISGIIAKNADAVMLGARTIALGEAAAAPLAYLRTTAFNARQGLPVYVGTQTDFSANTRIRVTVDYDYEKSTSKRTTFNYCAGYGYMRQDITATEPLTQGKHTLEWTAHANTAAYKIKIDGADSVNDYQTWWGLRSESYQMFVGNDASAYEGFYGKFYCVEMWDSSGVLRHRFLPDPSGVFKCEITGEMSTKFGTWTYGVDE